MSHVTCQNDNDTSIGVSFIKYSRSEIKRYIRLSSGDVTDCSLTNRLFNNIRCRSRGYAELMIAYDTEYSLIYYPSNVFIKNKR